MAGKWKVKVRYVPPGSPPGFVLYKTLSLYRNLTFFLEHSQPSLRLFSTCFQQNFQPHSPAGSKFYLEIFVTSQRKISKHLCRHVAATEHTSTPAAPGEAELPHRHALHSLRKAEKGAEPRPCPTLQNILHHLTRQG